MLPSGPLTVTHITLLTVSGITLVTLSTEYRAGSVLAVQQHTYSPEQSTVQTKHEHDVTPATHSHPLTSLSTQSHVLHSHMLNESANSGTHH